MLDLDAGAQPHVKFVIDGFETVAGKFTTSSVKVIIKFTNGYAPVADIKIGAQDETS